MHSHASEKGRKIVPLPPNEFYQSPFDGRWLDLDESEVFHLIDLQRKASSRNPIGFESAHDKL